MAQYKSKHNQKGVIYMLVNPIGQMYIGQTRYFDRRMEAYKTLQCTSQKLLYRSLVKYGFNCHSIFILKTCSAKRLDYWELKYIEEYKSCYRDSPALGLNILKESYADYLKIKGGLKGVPKVRKKRKIIQYNVFGDPVRQFDSIDDACKLYGIQRRQLVKALYKKDYYIGGFTWKYKN